MSDGTAFSRLTVSGEYTYTTAGTFQGVVTVTDSLTGFSAQTSFTAASN